jgi:hypothetical protein
MNNPLKWLTSHKFEAYAIAFLLMIIPPIPLYFAAREGSQPGMILLLALIVLGNLLALLIH